MRLRIAFAWQ